MRQRHFSCFLPGVAELLRPAGMLSRATAPSSNTSVRDPLRKVPYRSMFFDIFLGPSANAPSARGAFVELLAQFELPKIAPFVCPKWFLENANRVAVRASLWRAPSAPSGDRPRPRGMGKRTGDGLMACGHQGRGGVWRGSRLHCPQPPPLCPPEPSRPSLHCLPPRADQAAPSAGDHTSGLSHLRNPVPLSHPFRGTARVLAAELAAPHAQCHIQMSF